MLRYTKMKVLSNCIIVILLSQGATATKVKVVATCASQMSTANFCDAGTDINATVACPTQSQASCTKEVCCFDLKKCVDVDGQITCPAGLKFMPPASCGGISVDSCKISDCCQDYATCVNFDADKCEDNEFKEHGNTCPDVTDDSCTKGQCCAAKAFCPAAFDCGSQTVNTSAMCDGMCGIADCCPPYDASFDSSLNCTEWKGLSSIMPVCPGGMLFRPDGDCPLGCSEEVCCEAQETCSSKQTTPNFCPQGTDIDTTQVCPLTHSTSCTTDVCCKDLKLCSDAFAAGRISCTQATQVQVPQTSCGGISLTSCRSDECCQDYATCSSFNASRCDDNEVRVSARTCAGPSEGTCTKAGCCTARMHCTAEFLCSAGTVNTSAMCAGVICMASDEAVCCPSGTSQSSF